MWVTAFFTDKGTPETGLSPTIDIWDVPTGSGVVSGDTMIEIDGGWYKYDFSAYDNTKDYVIRCDGSATLSGNDRYVFGSNDIGESNTNIEFVKNIEGGKWEITGNQMIFYEDDNTTEVCRFNLTRAGVPVNELPDKRERV